MSENQYPLGNQKNIHIKNAGNRPLDELNMDALIEGELSADDLAIHADTLMAQAEISRRAGYPLLAENLTRAAELTRVPNQVLLELYETLRPGRSEYSEMIDFAHQLENKYAAHACARLFREAAKAYKDHGLLRV
jgi:propanediol dehydratase small subunit